MGWISEQLGRIRYGVPTSEKARLAAEGSLPNAPDDRTADQDVANRYAAGYLFGRQWPRVSKVVQPALDRLKTSSIIGFGGSSPELQSFSSYGASQGRKDTAKKVVRKYKKRKAAEGLKKRMKEKKKAP